MSGVCSARGAIVLTGLLGVAATMYAIMPQKPVVLWNASSSMPIGLYAVGASAGGLTEVVVANLPKAIGELAVRRRYLPAGVPVIKRVAGVAGDQVCVRDLKVFLNGRWVATRRRADFRGLPLAGWKGCRTLGREVFLLGDGPDSFDGRYFGPIDRAHVIGSARLLWAW